MEKFVYIYFCTTSIEQLRGRNLNQINWNSYYIFNLLNINFTVHKLKSLNYLNLSWLDFSNPENENLYIMHWILNCKTYKLNEVAHAQIRQVLLMWYQFWRWCKMKIFHRKSKKKLVLKKMYPNFSFFFNFLLVYFCYRFYI